MNKNIKDDEIINLAKKNNLICQNILYNKYRKKLTEYVINIYNQKDDVEDIVSDILIKVFLKLRLYNNKKSDFDTWVFNIMKNHMIDLWRKKVPDVIYNDDVYYENNHSISVWVDFSETHSDCMEFIRNENKIKKGDFNLLEMKYVYDFSYKDMSCYSDMSVSALANRVNYIKTKIKPLIVHQ